MPDAAVDAMKPNIDGDIQKIDQSNMDSDSRKNEHYLSFLGDKNSQYYLGKFTMFNNRGGGMIPSWNWPAFFFPGPWLLYRKMYGPGVTILLLSFIPILNWFIWLPVGIIAGVFGNSYYHKHVNKKINECLLLQDEGRIAFALNQSGGVHMWVKWAGVVLFILTFLLVLIGGVANA
ncbi:Protein of unknown function (DUF2628) [Mariprofundus ferrinatatus]|uniref:DUF2628 domain-containing protein n=1 Tax=Mariprofundus ferrinatatus TaxID=1921087 RepID=A0A2K8LA84_9PROT|nr:DUF2628 domain-containing protein [Mariprofundus ferrinatatus]ATX82811.1 Protein of unknown function (DUF2628) [Mariprofundus ferrinatatus]